MKFKNIIFPVFLFICSLIISIKIYDYVYWKKALNGPNGIYYKMISNYGMPPPMQQMFYYPYTGAHIQANAHYFGEIPLESTEFYKEMEFNTGKYGFFTEIDVDNPPAKRPNEFRIILIGGSSAQGWGAQYVKDMIYQSLERRLNEKLGKYHIKVTILNLAMAGSITYQNYAALNVWGHNFDPDLILSYSGGNDLLVPVATGSDAPMAWSTIEAYIESMHVASHNSTYRIFASWFPGLAYTTKIGRFAQFMDMSVGPSRVENEYANEREMTKLDRARQIATPLYIKAFQSIKRDFDGIPIMIAFQPIDFRVLPDTNQLPVEYTDMITRTIQACKSYKNSDWYFVNLRDYWDKNNIWAEAKLGNGLHLPTVVQEVVSKKLTAELEPIIRQLMEKRQKLIKQA